MCPLQDDILSTQERHSRPEQPSTNSSKDRLLAQSCQSCTEYANHATQSFRLIAAIAFGAGMQPRVYGDVQLRRRLRNVSPVSNSKQNDQDTICGCKTIELGCNLLILKRTNKTSIGDAKQNNQETALGFTITQLISKHSEYSRQSRPNLMSSNSQ